MVEMKGGSFHQNERLFVVEKATFFSMSAIQGGKGGGGDTASDAYNYLNENNYD